MPVEKCALCRRGRGMYLCGPCMEALMDLEPGEKRYAWFVAALSRARRETGDCETARPVIQYP